MKKTIPLLLFIVLLSGIAILGEKLREQRTSEKLPDKLPPMEIYFSPKGGCTEAIVREIGAAQKTILVQAYSFTSPNIADALMKARKRGIDIKVILDRSNETDKYSAAVFLLNNDIPPLLDDDHQIAHNKIMIIDGNVVITGSFNFTKQAENGNAENLLVIRDSDIAKKYAENWTLHAEHSRPYAGRSQEPNPSPERKSSKSRKSDK
jgi:phosphatidylserine/phosphatidylglycerophosphate/cardiolipin synthase-like enzyme